VQNIDNDDRSTPSWGRQKIFGLAVHQKTWKYNLPSNSVKTEAYRQAQPLKGMRILSDIQALVHLLIGTICIGTLCS
jgi:hypothetical protein